MSAFPVRNPLLPGLVGLAMLAVTLVACGGEDPEASGKLPPRQRPSPRLNRRWN